MGKRYKRDILRVPVGAPDGKPTYQDIQINLYKDSFNEVYVNFEGEHHYVAYDEYEKVWAFIDNPERPKKEEPKSINERVLEFVDEVEEAIEGPLDPAKVKKLIKKELGLIREIFSVRK